MSNPFQILGVDPGADDDTIRKRYLALIQEFTPEQHPDRFSQIRESYEKIRTLNLRAAYFLFKRHTEDSIEAIIEDTACSIPPSRFSLSQLLQVHQPAESRSGK